jgi:endonuclease III related protein
VYPRFLTSAQLPAVQFGSFRNDNSVMTHTAHQVYQHLFKSLGPQFWWPGDSPFEIMVGAVLVQNTAWKNVERGIANLKQANLLTPRKIYGLPLEDLAELIRPAGYFRIKAQRLHNLVKFFVERYRGSIAAMQRVDVARLREELLAVNGIGPETADSILLYAIGKPVMVVDTYTNRVFARHGWMPHGTKYHSLQAHLTEQLPVDPSIYNEFHALLVHVGHHYCSPVPRCESCPLRELLPVSGIVLPA